MQEFKGLFSVVYVIKTEASDYQYIGTATKDFKKYCKFWINKEEAEISWLEDSFKDYEHFVGVFGKFDPYTFFKAVPLKSELTYAGLDSVFIPDPV